jgi:hypothetical protein
VLYLLLLSPLLPPLLPSLLLLLSPTLLDPHLLKMR